MVNTRWLLVSGTPSASACTLSLQLPKMKKSLTVGSNANAVKSCSMKSQDELHVINIPDDIDVRWSGSGARLPSHHCRRSVQRYYCSLVLIRSSSRITGTSRWTWFRLRWSSSCEVPMERSGRSTLRWPLSWWVMNTMQTAIFLDIHYFINYQANWIVFLLQISWSGLKIAKLTSIIIVRQLKKFFITNFLVN